MYIDLIPCLIIHPKVVWQRFAFSDKTAYHTRIMFFIIKFSLYMIAGFGLALLCWADLLAIGFISTFSSFGSDVTRSVNFKSPVMRLLENGETMKEIAKSPKSGTQKSF